VQGGLGTDVVVREHAAVIELLAVEHKALPGCTHGGFTIELLHR
jgi:hypothetical protein